MQSKIEIRLIGAYPILLQVPLQSTQVAHPRALDAQDRLAIDRLKRAFDQHRSMHPDSALYDLAIRNSTIEEGTPASIHQSKSLATLQLAHRVKDIAILVLTVEHMEQKTSLDAMIICVGIHDYAQLEISQLPHECTAHRFNLICKKKGRRAPMGNPVF